MSTKPTRVNCDEIRELLPLYALDGLDEAERALLAQGLRNCPHLREEYETYRALRERLHYSARPVAPAPELRQRVLASATASERKPASATMRRAAKQKIWMWLAACLAAALVVTNAAWTWMALSRNVPASGGYVPVASGAVTRIEIAPEPAEASLSWVAIEEQKLWIVWFEGKNLRQPSQGAQYQLWLLREGDQPLRVGSIDVVEGTIDGVVFEISEPIRSFDTFQVTEEVDINVPAPTGDPVLSVEL
jgi:anti-sigma factor RsiW